MSIVAKTHGCRVVRLQKGRRIKLPDEFCGPISCQSPDPHIMVRYSERLGCAELCDPALEMELAEADAFLDERGQSVLGRADRLRCFFATSEAVMLGMDDRITLPRPIIQAVGIDDYAILLGTGRHYELWNPARLMAADCVDDGVRRHIAWLATNGSLPMQLVTPQHDEEKAQAALLPPHANDDANDEIVFSCGTRGEDDSDQDDGGASGGSASGDDEEAGIAVMEQQAGRIALHYHHNPLAVLRPHRTISYVTPLLTLETSQWVIVANRPGILRRRGASLEVLWRSARPGDAQASPTAFPQDWQEMAQWPGYDPTDRRMSGLPVELVGHFRQYRTQLEAFVHSENWLGRLADGTFHPRVLVRGLLDRALAANDNHHASLEAG